MPTFKKKPVLKITDSSGPQVDVSVSVDVQFNPTDVKLMEVLDVKWKLKCDLWEADTTDSDDLVVHLPSQTVDKKVITKPTTHTFHFSKKVDKTDMDQDPGYKGNEDFYARCELKDLSGSFQPVQSPKSAEVGNLNF